jgi:hypothetical protein
VKATSLETYEYDTQKILPKKNQNRKLKCDNLKSSHYMFMNANSYLR